MVVVSSSSASLIDGANLGDGRCGWVRSLNGGYTGRCKVRAPSGTLDVNYSVVVKRRTLYLSWELRSARLRSILSRFPIPSWPDRRMFWPGGSRVRLRLRVLEMAANVLGAGLSVGGQGFSRWARLHYTELCPRASGSIGCRVHPAAV